MYVNKKSFYICLMVLVMLLSSCSMSNNIINQLESTGKDSLPEDLPQIEKMEYEVARIEDEGKSVLSPYGIVAFNGQTIVADRENHCVFVLDSMNNIVKKIGSIGSGENEFCEPTGITQDENHVYVLDAGNSQIKILDKDLDFSDSIQLPILDHHQGGYRYIDIACTSDGTIYVSNNSPGQNDARILMLNGEKVEKLPLNFNGFLTSAGNSIYAASQLEPYTSQGLEGAASGVSYLYEIKKDKWELKFTYPNKYVPCDILFQNNAIMTMSYTWGRIDRINIEEKKITGIATIQIGDLNSYISLSPSNEILITSGSEQTIYILS